MSSLRIESNIEIKNNKGRKTGWAKEWFVGKDIYDSLNYNESVFFDIFEELNPKSLLNRLNRLSEKNYSDRIYRYNKEIKEVLNDGKIENIEGFRIHRIK